MRSDINNDKNLLDSAAQVFRSRILSGSRFASLLDASSQDARPPEEGEIDLAYSLRLSHSVESTTPQIGDMPPQPPTLRGRIGAVLVQAVRRSLFWYTKQIRAFHGMVAEAAREQAAALRELETRLQRQQSAIGDALNRVETLERQRQETLAQLRALGDQLQGLGGEISATDNRIATQDTHLRELREAHTQWTAETSRQLSALDALSPRLGQIESSVGDTAAALSRSIEAEGREVRRQIHKERTRLTQQEFRLNLLLRDVRKASRGGDLGDVAPVASEELQHANDGLFVDHARAFRGERAEIKSRLGVYADYVQQACAATGRAAALDLGCGRGEWLELLAEMNVPASGFDWNREFVEGCRARGLDARQGEIPRCLPAVPDESLSILSAFHVLEHIPFADLLEVLDQAVRILKPGGIAIFETPNPKNTFVSSNNFYQDPTHRHPIPSELLAFLVEARGLCDLKVLALSPVPGHLHLPASECPAVQFINEHFHGPQDYGIVACKPN